MPDITRLRLVWEPRLLSVVRIMFGLLFLEHGLAKVAGFPLQPTHVAFNPLTLNPGAQGLIELIGGGLLTLGLFTRPVAFILAGDMAAAYFLAHAPRGFFPLLNGGELAIVYCFSFLYFWLAGGGVWSLDRRRAPPATHVFEIWPEEASQPWLVSELRPERTGVAAVGERRVREPVGAEEPRR